jgi:hypothetical protein
MRQVDDLAVLLCMGSQKPGHRALPETGVKSRYSFADHNLASEAGSNFCDGHQNWIGATLCHLAPWIVADFFMQL